MTFREELQRLIQEYAGDARAEYHREADETFDREQVVRQELHSEESTL